MFGQFLGAVGPFENERDAEQWRDKYTQHEVTVIRAVTLMEPYATVEENGLDG
jgi:hypothetical protein